MTGQIHVRNSKQRLNAMGLLVLLAAGNAAGATSPSDFAGTFSFQGRIEPMTTLDTQNVYTQFNEGQTRLDQLQNEGYTCSSQPDYWWKCTKLRPDMPLPPALARHFQALYQGKLKLHFGPVSAPAVFLHGSGDTEEWRLQQLAELDSVKFSYFNDVRLGSVEKLIFGGDTELVVQTSNSGQRSYGFVESISELAEDGVSMHTYYAFLELDTQR